MLEPLTQDQLLLINLLLRIAVMAGIISLVMGFRFVVELLVRVQASTVARMKMTVLLASIFIIGVVVRALVDQGAMDLSLEGALLAGFLGGVWVGMGVGFAIGAACYLFGEVVALPLYTAAGLVSGLLFTTLGLKGVIWSYSLNPFLIIYNFIERLARGRLDRNFIPFALCFIFMGIRYNLLDRFGPRRLLYGYLPQDGFLLALDLGVLVYALGIALKIASNARMEVIIREEEKQLIHARLATLRSQVNPHFLFNTLNSITALIRTDAEKAREMTRKLSSIFRKSLEDASDSHSLRRELEFIDDYLSIEKVRFGEKLKVLKEVDPSTLDCEVPSMILQPLVENAIKHGVSRKTDGGILKISSMRKRSGVEIEIENEGPDRGPLQLEEVLSKGIGIRNVMERLNIYTGGRGELSIELREGGGAVVRFFVPGISERRKIIAD